MSMNRMTQCGKGVRKNPLEDRHISPQSILYIMYKYTL